MKYNNIKNTLYYTFFFILIYIIFYIINKIITSKKKENFTSKNIMKSYNVIFAGTCKNIENMLIHIDVCGNKFNSYKLIIYENDSTDNTRNLLIKNKKDNYLYIFEDNVTEPLRTIRLANGRNKILNKVREINTYNTYQYLIMIDLDDVNIT